MCFVITDKKEEQASSWEAHRTIEILAFHKEQQKVEILFLVYLSNKKKNNFLQLLHPGNIRCELVSLSAGLPWHQDELRNNERPENEEHNILKSIYGQMFYFDENNNKFHLNKILSPWDSFCDLAPEDQTKNLFVLQDDLLMMSMESLYPLKDESEWVPFSAWEVGPFPNKGDFLIAFKATIQKKSYTEFVESDPFFIVDGPTQLQDRIKHLYIPSLERAEQKKWEGRFKLFEDYFHFDESYDIVILRKPHADIVFPDMDSSSMITAGSLQSHPENCYRRYVSANSNFILKLSYRDGLFKDKKEFSFVQEPSDVQWMKDMGFIVQEAEATK